MSFLQGLENAVGHVQLSEEVLTTQHKEFRKANWITSNEMNETLTFLKRFVPDELMNDCRISLEKLVKNFIENKSVTVAPTPIGRFDQLFQKEADKYWISKMPFLKINGSIPSESIDYTIFCMSPETDYVQLNEYIESLKRITFKGILVFGENLKAEIFYTTAGYFLKGWKLTRIHCPWINGLQVAFMERPNLEATLFENEGAWNDFYFLNNLFKGCTILTVQCSQNLEKLIDQATKESENAEFYVCRN